MRARFTPFDAQQAGSVDRHLLNASPLQATLQRREEALDVLALAGFAHQADAPDLAFERAEASADFDVELLQKPLADSRFVDTRGDGDGIELPKLVAFLRSDGKAQFVESGFEQEVVLPVPIPTGLKPLLKDEPE